MKLMIWAYEKIKKRPAPYYYHYSLFKIIGKPFRKWLVNTVAPNCPFNCIRIFLYRLCGFKIGKKAFIGMHSYMDDVCAECIRIGDNVTISYGVYFACHGKNQIHLPIIIENGAYIGMRAAVISKNRKEGEKGVIIGKDAIVGACSLVNCHIPEKATAVGIPCRILEKQ